MSHYYLLVRSQQEENCYGSFTEEILASEGLNCFETVDIDNTPLPALGAGEIAILTRCFLRDSEIEALLQAVEKGARLVCFHPSLPLLARLGWTPQNQVVYPGRVAVRTGYPGARLTLQTHVPIILCKPEQRGPEYRIVATAAQDDGREISFPAVIRQPVGAGEVVLFFYDVPKAVARIRLGDPELASMATTGLWNWSHAADLFDGFLDDTLRHIPQADIHSQLLAKLLTLISPNPLARWWYYEEPQHSTAAIFVSDDDWSEPEHFDALNDALAKRNGHGTFYLVKETKLADERIHALQRLGHTVAPHVVSNVPDEMYFNFPLALKEETALLKRRAGALSTSLQTHAAPWFGYTNYASLCRTAGFRMLMHYISLPTARLNSFMCGSGRPMKFVEQNGTILDCWQQPGAVLDDASLVEAIQQNLNAVLARFMTLFNGCVYDHHTPLAIASHPVSFYTYSRPFIEACFDAFYRKHLPIYNADEWCALADRRRNAWIDFEGWAGDKLCWRVARLAGKLPLMIPAADTVGRNATVRVNGVVIESTRQRRLEEDYLFIPLVGDGSQELRIEVQI
jgi:hypothetical protein